ncbi:hypothetical protein JTE90_025020 [Oedothorax gibbosus]|uniref:Uncharacterized protein n=1 Tax=Oedothorax gibbosus TaxID=931172 RepID=A0AAV6TM35_9ARAC|nr:hypothetical protein JTE90_025020 [Oedothorax gibbosus]
MHLLLTSNGTIALMSRKSFLDLTRQGQHKRLKKLLQTAEDADVSFGCSASSSTPAILYEDAASPPEENSLDFLAPLQSDSLDIFYDALNEPPIESNDNYDYVLPAESLSSSLRNWALKYCITHVALTALLCILNEHRISDLPLDARTVLNTPKTVEVIRVGSGFILTLASKKTDTLEHWGCYPGTLLRIKMSKNYAVVLFVDENDAPGVVCTTWIAETNNSCRYPNVRTNEARDRCLKEFHTPEDNWAICRIKILKYYSQFQFALRNSKNAEETSHLESETEEEPVLYTKRKRRERHTVLPGEEDLEAAPKRRRIEMRTSLPPFPKPQIHHRSESPSPTRPSSSQILQDSSPDIHESGWRSPSVSTGFTNGGFQKQDVIYGASMVSETTLKRGEGPFSSKQYTRRALTIRSINLHKQLVRAMGR